MVLWDIDHFGFLFPVHENARFRGWEWKNGRAVHKNGGFRGRGPGYLHDLNENTILNIYKMADFKD